MDYKDNNTEALQLENAKGYSPQSQSSNLESFSPKNDHKKLMSESLRVAQDQLGLCLQKQRQIGFIIKEIKSILKN